MTDRRGDQAVPILELTPEQCWTRLHGGRLGRIALMNDGAVEILPVNYTTLDRTIVFATSSDVLLRAAEAGRPVAFEVDAHDGWTAWSVVVRGRSEIVDESPTGDRLRSMLPTPKKAGVRIVPAIVTGRLFDQAP